MRSLPPLFTIACSAIVLTTLPQFTLAQTRLWANSVNGLWTDAARWSPNDVPNGPTEGAAFEVFGTYAVTLLDADPLILIDELQVPRGIVTLRTDGVGDGAVRVQGNAAVGGELRLTETGSTHVDLDVAGELSVLIGARLLVDGGPLSASSTSLQGGSSVANTTLVLDSGASAALGAVSVAANGATSSRAGIDAFNGSTISADDIRIATEDSNTVGEFVLDNSQLTQSLGSTTIVGQERVEGTIGRGALTVANGGSLTLGALTIHETGSVVNDGSFLALGGTLDLAGGTYLEHDTVQRDTTAVDHFRIRDGGQATFTTQPLTVAAGQQLRLDRGTLDSAEGLVINGSMRVGSADASTVAGQTTLAAGTLTIEAGSEVRFSDPFLDQGGLLDLQNDALVVFESDYAGFGSVGSGTIEFEGVSSAGNSVGLGFFGGDVSWGSSAQLVAEIAGSTSGDFDQVITTGTATLAGGLVVELLDGSGFSPTEGDSFTLLTAAGITGSFDTLTLPVLSAGLEWRTEQTNSTLTLRVVTPSVPGDFNHDGFVDAADYTVWRNTEGSVGHLLAADANNDQSVDQADLAVWQSSYGAEAGSPIPEPSALMIVSAVGIAAFARPPGRKVARSTRPA